MQNQTFKQVDSVVAGVMELFVFAVIGVLCVVYYSELKDVTAIYFVKLLLGVGGVVVLYLALAGKVTMKLMLIFGVVVVAAVLFFSGGMFSKIIFVVLGVVGGLIYYYRTTLGLTPPPDQGRVDDEKILYGEKVEEVKRPSDSSPRTTFADINIVGDLWKPLFMFFWSIVVIFFIIMFLYQTKFESYLLIVAILLFLSAISFKHSSKYFAGAIALIVYFSSYIS